MEFSRQAHLGGLSFPIPKDLPDPGIEPTLSVYQLSKVGTAAAESEAGEQDAGGTTESQARKTG